MSSADRRFLADLRKAAGNVEHLAAVAAAVDPKGDAPAPGDLAAWWPDVSQVEAEALAAPLRDLAAVTSLADWTPFQSEGWSLDADRAGETDYHLFRTGDGATLTANLAVRLPADFGGEYLVPKAHYLALSFRSVSRAWLAARDRGFDGPHPLGALVRAWLARPTAVTPYHVRNRASLPDLDRESDQLDLPDLADSPAPSQLALNLPGMDPGDDPLPHWLLSLYRLSGGPISQGGRLPLPLSLAVGALARLPVERRTGAWHTLRFPHRIEHEDRFAGEPAVERWLWPDGWGSRRGRWELIPRGLADMRRDLAYLSVPGLGLVMMLAPSVIPQTRDDPLVEFTVRIPARRTDPGSTGRRSPAMASGPPPWRADTCPPWPTLDAPPTKATP